MHHSHRNSQGFGIIETILVLLVIAVIGFVGWYVWQAKQNTNKSLSNANSALTGAKPTVKKSTTAATAQPANPYVGWQSYKNDAYGISYKYPTSWMQSGDVTADATTKNASATKQEFSTGLKLKTNTKYNNTMEIEVLDENLNTAVSYYDSYFTQSPLDKVDKKSETLKGKSAVSYDVTNSGNESKLYLFSVGNKTYTLRSIDEELNVQANADYWTTFQKVFDSFTINI